MTADELGYDRSAASVEEVRLSQVEPVRPPNGLSVLDQAGFRPRVERCLDAFGRMIREGRFAPDEPRTGLEVELALVDDRMLPAMRNHAVLDRSDSDLLTSELGSWNVEINSPPRTLPGAAEGTLEQDIRDTVSEAAAAAGRLGARVVTIGILPTLRAEHLEPGRLTDDPRYGLLNEQMVRMRGEPFRLEIASPADGAGPPEHLLLELDSVAAEAACTSLQLHLQLSPDTFAAYWNAAQAIAGVQIAVAANSPFLLGRRLWAETRVPLFTQATDVRTEEQRTRGAPPRVWFGDRWTSSVEELLTQNVRHFDALLPLVDREHEEDPHAALDAGRAPALAELCLHNSTVWRWNRPVYGVADGVPHLRLENRVLPAGPTATDAAANAFLYYGLVRALAEQEHPVWRHLSFAAAEANFVAGARHGIDASMSWPGRGTVGVPELIRETLLPLARDGLVAWGVDPAVADRHLSVIEQRCRRRRTGTTWQTEVVADLERRGVSRAVAMRQMLARYLDGMDADEPVHTWQVG
jgi:hypothetical protein